MSQHARLSPSDKTWPNCPGSVRENEAYADIPGEAAIDGTGSHLLLELCMKAGVRAETYIDQIIGINHEDNPGGWMIHPDRAERVQMCLDYISLRVKQLREIYGSKISVETESRSNPGALCGRLDWYGTCDVTITVTNDHNRCVYLEVIDYKDGRGYVDEVANTQLESYLFGKMEPYIADSLGVHPERVGDTRQTIVQPKTDPVIRYVDKTGIEAFEIFDELAAAAEATDDPNAPLVPDGKRGKGYCRWCNHGRSGNCIALNDGVLSEVNGMKDMTEKLMVTHMQAPIFEMTTMADIKRMDDRSLAALFDREAAVLQVFEHIREELTERVKTRGVNGFEMGNGKGENLWAKKQEEIAKVLKKTYRLPATVVEPKALISPAQVLKLKELSKEQKAKIQADLIVFKAGKQGTKLQRVAYKRETLTAEEMFGAKKKAPNFLEGPVVKTPPNFL